MIVAFLLGVVFYDAIKPYVYFIVAVGIILKEFAVALVLEPLHKDYELYRYDGASCENVRFIAPKDMIMLENKTRSAMNYQLYPVSRYSLRNYDDYKRFNVDIEDGKIDTSGGYDFHKEIRFYGKNTSFVVEGYYHIISKMSFGHGGSYILVKTPDGTLAWLFDGSVECDTKNAKKVFIPYKTPPKAFSDDEDRFEVSKQLLKKVVKKDTKPNTQKLIELIETEEYEEAKRLIKKHKLKLSKKDMDTISDMLTSTSNPSASWFHYFILENQNKGLKVSGINIKTDPLTKKKTIQIIGENPNMWTPLMLAFKNQDRYEITKALNQPVDINATTHNGSTALFVAIKYGTEGDVKKLLKLGFDINHINNFGYTPLGIAVKLNDYKKAKILMDFGADFEMGKLDNLPFMVEIHKSEIDYDFLSKMLEYKNLMQYKGENLNEFLHYALLKCDQTLVKFILDNFERKIEKKTIDDMIEDTSTYCRDVIGRSIMHEYLKSLKKL